MFQSDQYFIVFEFIDGGVDLERFQFNSTEEALSVLQQVAISLSVAEESLMFEHRDLHWGNVLIKRTKCKKIHYKLGGDDICVKSAGVFVSIIDFTLSRLTKGKVDQASKYSRTSVKWPSIKRPHSIERPPVKVPRKFVIFQ